MAAVAGKVVVVTGATRGIGRASALAFARVGAKVVLVGRSTDAAPHRLLPGTLESALAEVEGLGASALAVTADVSSAGDVERVAEQTLSRFGRCDVLVNNAAYSTDFGLGVETPVKRWDTAWKVNVVGPLLLMQAFVPGMLTRGDGRVINISSGAATRHVPGQLPYGATKLALERTTTGFAADHAETGVAFNVIRIDEPIPTEAYQLVSGSIGATQRGVPLNTPEDLGAAVVWLAGRDSSSSGQIHGLAQLRELGALPQPSTVLS